MARYHRLGRFGVLALTIVVSVWLVLKSYGGSASVISTTRDHKNLLVDRARFQKLAQQPPQKENATFVTLARNEELTELLASINEVESRFNKKYHYDWVFLNDADFSSEFIEAISAAVSGEAKFGHIPQAHWSYPDFIDQERAAAARERMKEGIYGDSESYRHMCRFESGFFWRHPLLDTYKYYWRVEPSIKLMCDIAEDPFTFMRENNKRYGFTIALIEYEWTVETLWQETRNFMDLHPEHVNPHNALRFVSSDDGESYNLCHFWSNFEIADLDFWRSDAYRDYFDFLDQAGGFFYERWGDAPVHSIAASIFLDRDEIHWFSNIGYFHHPFQNCPVDAKVRQELNCACPDNPDFPDGFRENFSFKPNSCVVNFIDAIGLP